MTIIGLYGPIIACADDVSVQASMSPSVLLHVRTLAASCAACHGTDGNSVGSANSNTPNDLSRIASLATIEKTEFIRKMLAFKTGQRPATVMQHHAKGLSSQEIESLAEYFSRLPSRQVTVLHPEPLIKDDGH